MHFDLTDLRRFAAIVEAGSITHGAERANLALAAASTRIRNMEKSVGAPLLLRNRQGVMPTPAGRILYGYARRIIQLRDEAMQAMHQYRGDLSGTLALGASTIPGAYVLPPLIESFRLSHPAIQLHLRIADTAAVVEELLHDRLELGLVGARLKEHRLDCDETE